MSQKVHLIAIGGSIMHNLALELKDQGYLVSGSDDQIYEPARTRLESAGILPNSIGWRPEVLSLEIDIVILGMHAKKDNPELIKAQELGLKIYSFPEFVASKSLLKKRISIAGSHGKTTTCSMVMHTLKNLGLDFDYLVGAQIEGFNHMVSLKDAPIIVIESDEYLSSCIDPRPKFLHYIPDIAIITGIAWDHFNVFPTLESYENAFVSLIQSMHSQSILIYFEGDQSLVRLVKEHGAHLKTIPYKEAPSKMVNGNSILLSEGKEYPTNLFGSHNYHNMQAVIELCKCLGLEKESVIQQLSEFKGSSKRMELLAKGPTKIAYLDFAHSPSKVKATLSAFREKHPLDKILVLLELHTYSSLSLEFLPQYHQTTSPADHIILYFDPIAMQIKNMVALKSDDLMSAFDRYDMDICTSTEQLKGKLSSRIEDYNVLIFMGSGQFGGIDVKAYAKNWVRV